MCAAADLKIIKALEWCTDLPSKDQSRRSPAFFVEGDEWFFEMRFDRLDSLCLYTRLKERNSDADGRISGIHIHTFQVGLKSNRTLNLDGGDFRLVEGSSVWNITWTILKKKLTDSFISGHCIKFRFFFDYGSKSQDLKISGETDDKCIQTASYLNANISGESLPDDLSKMLETGFNYDAEIKCGDHSSKAHKAVLCARSEVFKAMLLSGMLEGQTGVLQLQDIDVRYFQDFMQYLYTGSLPELTFNKAMALYEVGDKYSIRSLLLRCSEYLQDNISPENVFDCFSLGEAHSDWKLLDKTKAYILDKKVYLEDEYWIPFCEKFPKVAIELYRMSHKKIKLEEE